MIAGISTATFYPMYTEEALKTLVSMRVESVEVFANCHSEITVSMLREMRRIADDGGVKILALHPYTSPIEPIQFFSNYPRRFEEGRELYKRYYEAANMLGAQLVVFHGGARAANLDYSFYFDKFGTLWEDSLKNGSRLCHENVERCTGHCPAFFKELAKAVPGVEFVFDIKQAIRAGENVFEFAKAMGSSIRHVHLSDHDTLHDCLPPGSGSFNIMEFLVSIAKNGFDKGVIVELYRENFDGIVELSMGYQRLLTHISTLRKNDEINNRIRQSM